MATSATNFTTSPVAAPGLGLRGLRSPCGRTGAARRAALRRLRLRDRILSAGAGAIVVFLTGLIALGLRNRAPWP